MNEFYLSEKQLRRKRFFFRLKIYGGILIVASFLIAAAHFVLFSQFFRVKEVRVNVISSSETEFLSTDERKEEFFKGDFLTDLRNFLVGRSKIASVLGTDNFLAWEGFDDSDIEYFKKFYSQLIDFEIKKDYLERKISIDLKRRGRFGVWCESSSPASSEKTEDAPIGAPWRCLWFDREGIVFAEAPFIEGRVIYRLEDRSGRSLKVGDSIFNERLNENFLKILNVLNGAGMGMRAFLLDNIAAQEITAYSESKPLVRFSLRINPEFALEFLKSLSKSDLEKMEYIDLRVENRAYYKLK